MLVPMDVTILAVGGRGDVEPLAVLGRGLVQAGHRVRLATHALFEPLARRYGLEMALIEGNPRELLESPAGQRLAGSGANPIAFARGLRRLLGPLLETHFVNALEVCEGSDAIVKGVLAFPAPHVAQHLRVPCFAALVQPASPTREFADVTAPQVKHAPGLLNLLSWHAGEQLLWLAFGETIDRIRRELLGLGPLPRRGPFRSSAIRRIPILYGFSPSVVPKPRDWDSWTHVCGFWFSDTPAGWSPEPALVEFLEAGPPPVYVGFGSMPSMDDRKPAQLVLEALRRAGRRGVLASGWGALGPAEASGDVYVVNDVPHDWLFPRVTAVVHHGGPGTTASAMRAGRPAVVVPYGADNPFWGMRVAALGVGPAPIPRKKLTAERLAAALRATEDVDMHARAAALAARLRAEDGVARAVEAFAHHLGLARRRRPGAERRRQASLAVASEAT
jgi:UDP:flavonoid glycosyltransferase YjiC (YdhE family)